MPLTGNNNLIYLISSTVTSNTACSQKCVKISAVFKNRLNDCNVLKSAELASSAFHTLTTRLQKKYCLVLRKLIHVHLKQDWPGPRHDLILPPPPCDPTRPEWGLSEFRQRFTEAFRGWKCTKTDFGCMSFHTGSTQLSLNRGWLSKTSPHGGRRDQREVDGRWWGGK